MSLLISGLRRCFLGEREAWHFPGQWSQFATSTAVLSKAVRSRKGGEMRGRSASWESAKDVHEYEVHVSPSYTLRSSRLRKRGQMAELRIEDVALYPYPFQD